jgi:hypothetical protein
MIERKSGHRDINGNWVEETKDIIMKLIEETENGKKK